MSVSQGLEKLNQTKFTKTLLPFMIHEIIKWEGAMEKYVLEWPNKFVLNKYEVLTLGLRLRSLGRH